MDGQIASPRQPANPDSDVMLVASFGGSNSDSEYVELAEKSPLSLTNMPYLARHTSKLETMHEVSEGEINGIV